jgi:hypothetical protein
MKARDSDHIAAKAEIGRVAEAHQPAPAEQQIEAGGGDGEDHNAGGERDHIIAAEQGRGERYGHEASDDDEAR